ncbi:hypothetical protein GNE08_13100 [Trichormus variabilis ARAD]|nr:MULTISPECIES: hypothetical protein [Nostocaceae]MBC1215158.1 hypothetical protein [Trichormus variabilis ARAD]MBC1257523.1 hypothetical protein [Trichormus variabilis V5]MBC1267304.1 hypothetical protein [Trichormus variabilis FSR]MBC1304084.1 hypothetical protein [Trichormus variabilis N2B]MBC1311578.1 hypothetical protein [Trichormus variabilis PNB]
MNINDANHTLIVHDDRGQVAILHDDSIDRNNLLYGNTDHDNVHDDSNAYNNADYDSAVCGNAV